MSSTQSISAALKSVDAKKDNLRKVFEDLQSHSSLLSSFTLQWKDLEDHFDSIQKSIEARLNELKSKEGGGVALASVSINGSVAAASQPSQPVKETLEMPEEIQTVARPELKSLCFKMDGMGLRSFIMNHRKELTQIRDEVGDALKSASDPAKLVLESMVGFYPPYSKGDKDGELAAIRRTCILLLERLYDISPQIENSVKEKAFNLAFEWKGKIAPGGQNPLEALAFLQLLATFSLGSAFNAEELIDIAVTIARRKQAIDLCRSLGFTDKVPDLIQKLSDNGQHLDAVKFAYAFELVDKFPPVPLLKAYLKHAKKIAQDVRKKGNHSAQSQNEATAKELAAVKAIIKCVEEHNLEAEFPRDSLDKRVEQLERQKAEKKRPANIPLQQHPNSAMKRPRPASHTLPIMNTSGVVPLSQVEYQAQTQPQPLYHPSIGMLPERELPYRSSTAQYGSIPGTSHGIPSYLSSASAPYGGGAGSNPLNYSSQQQQSPSRSNLYSFEQHVSAALYDRATGYGSHGLPPPTNRPSYYP